MEENSEFLQKYGISYEKFLAADISKEVLRKIYDDYNMHQECYIKTGKELLEKVFNEPHKMGLHTVYWRIKDAEHLIAKIIRKRNENYKKYQDIDEHNYWKIVRDLLGFRGLMVFKEEWPNVHKQILGYFKDDPKLYFDEDSYGKFDSEEDCYLAEPTKVHVREGDDKSLYLKYLGSENIASKKNYRSIHYVLKYHGICFELQLRTLFEEALCEMDHRVRYPIRVQDKKLNRYSGIMNHLVGVADELGSFYMELSDVSKESTEEQVINDVKKTIEQGMNHSDTKEILCMDTPAICLSNILKN